MEVNYLLDTNIFLEILLNQEKSELCKSYLNQNLGKIYVSEFSLHSIGVILFRNKKYELYRTFLNDILPKIKIVDSEIKTWLFDIYQAIEEIFAFNLEYYCKSSSPFKKEINSLMDE